MRARSVGGASAERMRKEPRKATPNPTPATAVPTSSKATDGASIPPTVKIDLVSDRTDTIRASVADGEFELGLAVVLVVIVIFVFLRTLPGTIIPSLSVPLSLVGTFGVMYLLGFSLDNLSLMALTIATGFVVDDAIVMLENIVRYIEAGDPPMEAALKGAGQIGFTIISISVSLVAVFIPLIFMSGIIGRLFREFAMTVTVAVLVSALVSLTLTPVMCSLFLSRETQHGSGNRLNQLAEAFFDGMVRYYDRGLVWVFRHQLSMLVATLALIVLTGYLYVVIPKGFFPQQDTGMILGITEAAQNISFPAMVQRQQAMNWSRAATNSAGVLEFAAFAAKAMLGSMMSPAAAIAL